MKIAQIGKGFVGGALNKSFAIHGVESSVYDKLGRLK